MQSETETLLRYVLQSTQWPFGLNITMLMAALAINATQTTRSTPRQTLARNAVALRNQAC